MAELPLFPLQSVLFPGGELRLKVFEARYLEWMGTGLRQPTRFGVVNLKRGTEVQRPDSTEAVLESVGVAANLEDVDVPQAGIMLLRARGMQRFRIQSTSRRDNGLWVAQVVLIEGDDAVQPESAHAATVAALGQALARLREMGEANQLGGQGPTDSEPAQMQNAGWVANRWCELLPIPVAAKQSLMELQDPLVRLSLVDRYLRDKGVVA